MEEDDGGGSARATLPVALPAAEVPGRISADLGPDKMMAVLLANGAGWAETDAFAAVDALLMVDDWGLNVGLLDGADWAHSNGRTDVILRATVREHSDGHSVFFSCK